METEALLKSPPPKSWLGGLSQRPPASLPTSSPAASGLTSRSPEKPAVSVLSLQEETAAQDSGPLLRATSEPSSPPPPKSPSGRGLTPPPKSSTEPAAPSLPLCPSPTGP